MSKRVTITEALAELKTIAKRRSVKEQNVYGCLFRQEQFKDPLEKDGGSVTFVSKERQAIRDLEERTVDIRRAIAHANDATLVTVDGQTRSVSEWLTWRRDVAPKRKELLTNIRQKLDQVRREAQSKGLSVTVPGEAKNGQDIVVNVNEKEIAVEMEAMESVLGGLDGQLSLKNATVTIEV